MKHLAYYIKKNVQYVLKLVKILEKKFPCCVEYTFEDGQVRLEVWCLIEDEKAIKKVLEDVRYT